MAKILVKATEDFKDRENSMARVAGTEFLVREEYSKSLIDEGLVEIVKEKKEPSPKEKRIAEKREKALIETGSEKKIIEKPGMEIIEKVKKK